MAGQILCTCKRSAFVRFNLPVKNPGVVSLVCTMGAPVCCTHDTHRCAILSKRHTCRRERRRKLGLPEELTEEEKAAERARAEEEAAREAAKRLPVRPVTKIAKMREILVQMKKASAGEEVRLHTRVCGMGACVVCMQVEIAPVGLCSTLACGAQELNLRCQTDM